MSSSQRPRSVLALFFGLIMVLPAGLLAQTLPFGLGDSKAMVRTQLAGRTQDAWHFDLEERSEAHWRLTDAHEQEYKADIRLNFLNDSLQVIRGTWTGLDSSYTMVMYQWYEANVEATRNQLDFVEDVVSAEKYRNNFPADQTVRTAVFATADFTRRVVYVFHAADEGAKFTMMWQRF